MANSKPRLDEMLRAEDESDDRQAGHQLPYLTDQASQFILGSAENTAQSGKMARRAATAKGLG